MKFYLEIQMGNAAMQTRRHLAETIREVAYKLESNKLPIDQNIGIMDWNGNTVGSWHLKDES